MDFANKIKKANGPRVHKFTDSYNLRDYYHHYKRTHDTTLSEHKYNDIVRDIFSSLVHKELVNMLTVCLPNKMGFIAINILKPKVYKEGDEYKCRFPVDWKNTLKLWEHDRNAMDEKLLIYSHARETSVVNYTKDQASFKNQRYYYLKPARRLKIYIHDQVINNNKFNIK